MASGNLKRIRLEEPWKDKYLFTVNQHPARPCRQFWQVEPGGGNHRLWLGPPGARSQPGPWMSSVDRTLPGRAVLPRDPLPWGTLRSWDPESTESCLHHFTFLLYFNSPNCHFTKISPLFLSTPLASFSSWHYPYSTFYTDLCMCWSLSPRTMWHPWGKSLCLLFTVGPLMSKMLTLNTFVLSE